MKIDSICALLIDFLRQNHYKESTLCTYKESIRQLKQFYATYHTDDYSPEIGNLFANNVKSKKTGNFNRGLYKSRGRFIRLLNSYFYTGNFNLCIKKRGKQQPDNPSHLRVFMEYEKFLNSKFEVKTTISSYLNSVYYFLQYLNSINLSDLKKLTSKEVFSYIKSLKPNQQHNRLLGLREILKFLNRNDLLSSIEGVHAIRYSRIVPMLSENEKQNLIEILNSNQISVRDSSIIKLGFYGGIRGIDVMKLKLSDIDWNKETISFIQSKTGNPVTLPLITDIGNSIAEYLTKERPKINSPFLFLSTYPPYNPLASHAAFYSITKKAFELAGIQKKGRIYGMHMLRHNAASSMVQNEVPLETIAAILGHANPNSTSIYITTDEQRLKECVLSMELTVPEGAL